jgi:L-threonylcarbamoyladenylate synthase
VSVGSATMPPACRIRIAADRPASSSGTTAAVTRIPAAAHPSVLPRAGRRHAPRRRGWPGGLTLVLPQRLGITLPAVLTGGRRTIGLRVPDHPSPRALAAGVGPLPVTSANVSGLPSAGTAAEILAQLGDAIDLILDGGPSHGGPASTVVDCTGSQPRILRSGAIDPDAVAACLRSASLPEPAPWEDSRGSGGRE